MDCLVLVCDRSYCDTPIYRSVLGGEILDDLISRKTAIARIDKCVTLSGIGLEPVMAVRDVKALISVLPAVDAVPVEWLERRRDMYMKTISAGNLRIAAVIDQLMREWKTEQEAQK